MTRRAWTAFAAGMAAGMALWIAGAWIIMVNLRMERIEQFLAALAPLVSR